MVCVPMLKTAADVRGPPKVSRIIMIATAVFKLSLSASAAVDRGDSLSQQSALTGVLVTALI